MQYHFEVGLGIAQAIDSGHRRHHQRIVPLHQGLGGRQAHLFDMLIDRRIFLDKGIRGWHVGFRLVVVVIGNKILYGVVGEELFELAVELCREGFIVGHHDDGALHLLHHLGNGKGLAGAGNPQQGLVQQTVVEPLDQAGNGGGLIPGWLKIRCYRKACRHPLSTLPGL